MSVYVHFCPRCDAKLITFEGCGGCCLYMSLLILLKCLLLWQQISDDEDDTHPNVDTASLFRWRHQARVERMDKEQQEKQDLEKKKKTWLNLIMHVV